MQLAPWPNELDQWPIRTQCTIVWLPVIILLRFAHVIFIEVNVDKIINAFTKNFFVNVVNVYHIYGISRKPLEIEAWFQRTTNRKWHMGIKITWPQRCCEAVRSAILAIAWLLVCRGKACTWDWGPPLLSFVTTSAILLTCRQLLISSKLFVVGW